MNKAVLVCLIFLFAYCNNSGADNDAEKKPARDSAIAPKKIKDIEPDLWKADRLQIVYYDNPDGDSLRYTRFFKYIEINDSFKVNRFLKELNQAFVQQRDIKKCRSEGKLFLMNNDDILKTVYFSTRGDSCSYLYFIKDGAFIYLPLSDEAMKFLNENKTLAKKP